MTSSDTCANASASSVSKLLVGGFDAGIGVDAATGVSNAGDAAVQGVAPAESRRPHSVVSKAGERVDRKFTKAWARCFEKTRSGGEVTPQRPC